MSKRLKCKTSEGSFSCDLETDIGFSKELIGRMIELTENQSLSHHKKKELAEDTSDRNRMEPWEAKETFAEVGAPVCKVGESYEIAGEQIGTGTSSYIGTRPCKAIDGKRAGSFHTHPTPPPTPSRPDLRVMNKEDDDFMCVGSKVADKPEVYCFFPKTEESTGFVEYKMVSRGLRGKTKTYPDHKIGEINIWEKSELTPLEILEKYDIIIEDASDESGVPEEEFREELRQGNIPRPIIKARREGKEEKVDLPVYDKEGEKKMTRDSLKDMRGFYINEYERE